MGTGRDNTDVQNRKDAGIELFVSVVIPVKADADGLVLTLASIPHRDDVEIIVIDGGADAATADVVAANASRFAYHECGLDSGIANAMNRGIDQARGEFVAILNAGDVWRADTLDRVSQALAATPDTEVVHGALQFADDLGNTHVVSPQIEKMSRRMWMFHPTMFVRKSTYDQVGGYNESLKLAMDSEWCHRALQAGINFVQAEGVLATMALGGRSDVNYLGALAEYRRSVITHRLTTPMLAWWWFVFFSLGKTVRRAWHSISSR